MPGSGRMLIVTRPLFLSTRVGSGYDHSLFTCWSLEKQDLRKWEMEKWGNVYCFTCTWANRWPQCPSTRYNVFLHLAPNRYIVCRDIAAHSSSNHVWCAWQLAFLKLHPVESVQTLVIHDFALSPLVAIWIECTLQHPSLNDQCVSRIACSQALPTKVGENLVHFITCMTSRVDAR